MHTLHICVRLLVKSRERLRRLALFQMELGRSKSTAASALEELASRQPMCISSLRQYVTSAQTIDAITPHWTDAVNYRGHGGMCSNNNFIGAVSPIIGWLVNTLCLVVVEFFKTCIGIHQDNVISIFQTKNNNKNLLVRVSLRSDFSSKISEFPTGDTLGVRGAWHWVTVLWKGGPGPERL